MSGWTGLLRQQILDSGSEKFFTDKAGETPGLLGSTDLLCCLPWKSIGKTP